MIHIYGDSHAEFSFTGLSLAHQNHREYSITMFRIGRDNTVINFNIHELNTNDILVFVYGEVDCRCHIKRQMNLGRNEDEIIFELVEKYIQTIKNSLNGGSFKIIIVGVIPPTKQDDFESINGPIQHEFPFVGSDEERLRFTQKVNHLLEQFASQNDFIYFNPYDYYTRPDGTLKHELSDSRCHIGQTSHFLEQFVDLLSTQKSI
jgi:hypothetical protein